MSRSRKKINISGITTSKSEKNDKRLANRKLRRKNKVEVHVGKGVFTKKREASNIWSFAKDGKWFLSNPIYLRK